MLGEIISLGVAFSWTLTAMFAEVGSKRMGSLPMNVVRMSLSLLLLALTLWLTLGVPYPLFADGQTWFWLCLSGFVGYVLGDYCLFTCYILIGSRFGQLLMTLSAPFAAITAWVLLGETMSWLAIVGMIVTLSGIALSVLNKSNDQDHRHKFALKLPLRGVLLGMGAGAGQGVGLVLSKVGMEHYQAAIVANGITDASSWISPDAILPISLGTMMPFASTMIRAVLGLLGFCVALFFFTRGGGRKLSQGIRDGKALAFTSLATIFGPFIGVSLSLMATLYTHAGIAQTIMSLTPVFILWPSYLFFKQQITWLEVLGAIISVAGVCLFFV
ncbi:MAG: DMT family transporter [Bacteroidales bacterium]|nr:DMT family transporter [Bacteroidales bacterium]